MAAPGARFAFLRQAQKEKNVRLSFIKLRFSLKFFSDCTALLGMHRRQYTLCPICNTLGLTHMAGLDSVSLHAMPTPVEYAEAAVVAVRMRVRAAGSHY